MVALLKRFLFFIFMLFLSVGCDNRSEMTNTADSIMKDVTKTLESRHHFYYAGRRESSDKGRYRKLGLYFDKYGTISKDEGRRIIIDCMNEFLNQLHANSKMRLFLKEPFTYDNLDINIVIVDSYGQRVFFPHISIIAIGNGKIHYSTYSEEKRYEFYTTEEETFDEAFRIIADQNTDIRERI